MNIDPRTPVLVGAGVAQRRCDDPEQALESVELMVEALENAAKDAGSRELLAEASSVRVPRGFWEYSDPGRLVADRFGAGRARTVLAEIGVLQQTLLSDACRAIASGEERVALVAGGDAKYRSLRAKITGKEIHDTTQQGVAPDQKLEPEGALWSDLEWDRGLMMPVHYFGVMENALRYHQGLGLEDHREQVARIWSGFSEVAARNPHAWGPAPVSAEEIREPSAKNKPIAHPYLKLHNSNWNVDQAAGLILCSVETARAHGILEDRWVFPLSATESNHMVPLAARSELHRSQGVAIGGRRALELAGKGIDEIEHVDLYSCFPAVPRVFALELGIDLGRPLTVTGGMAFAGGPLNNYVLQATARMVEVLREDPGSTGLVTTISGFINKCGFGLWSTSPPGEGFQYADVTQEVAASGEARELVSDYAGPARVAGYTVLYLGETASKGIAVCDLPDRRRTVANTVDADLIAHMTNEEFCGRELEVSADGSFRAL